MNTRNIFVAALFALRGAALAEPVTTAFTYQGRLHHNGSPANGIYDLRFELYVAATGGSPIGAPVVLPSQIITGGLFSADLNFGGPAVFDGTAYWLAVSAKPGGTATYVPVPGRAAIRPAPYSIHALSAAGVKDGAITSNSLANGAVTGAKLASSAVGLAQLNATGTPGSGQVLAYNGSGLSWITPPGGGGGGPWLLNGVNTYYNNGNVGIGTQTPANKLTVRTTDSGYGMEHTNGTVRLATYAGGANPFGGWLGTISNHPLSFFVNDGSSSMVIATNGNVGIGTVSAAGKLHLFDGSESVQVIECGGGINSGARLKFKNPHGQWETGTSRGYNDEEYYIYRSGSPSAQFAVRPNGDAYAAGDITANRIILRADPDATTNTAVLCTDPSVVNFVPYNKATNRPLNLITRDATVRQLTITGGADLAEPFPIKERGIEKGSVVVIDEDHPGRLKLSTGAYDRKVAGIVSGARGIQPGISMIQEDALEAGENVSLSGRVYVKADTSAGPIGPGDLLTTSTTPGLAMKAAVHDKAQGAILGKAMTSLSSGEGMVLVLVTLQ
jgi:hypothetical protein